MDLTLHHDLRQIPLRLPLTGPSVHGVRTECDSYVAELAHYIRIFIVSENSKALEQDRYPKSASCGAQPRHDTNDARWSTWRRRRRRRRARRCSTSYRRARQPTPTKTPCAHMTDSRVRPLPCSRPMLTSSVCRALGAGPSAGRPGFVRTRAMAFHAAAGCGGVERARCLLYACWAVRAPRGVSGLVAGTGRLVA